MKTKKELINDLNYIMLGLGYEYIKYDKGFRYYENKKSECCISIIKINIDTGFISKKQMLYNNFLYAELNEHKKIINIIKELKNNCKGE